MTSYYDEHADAFVAASITADMSALYERFLAYVPPGGRILDAGCGSGRDSRAFLDRGYDMLACDASAAMVARSAVVTGRPTLQLRFQELAFDQAFDGIWACASLLHVPHREMDDVMERLARALKPGGALFLSVKYGEDEGVRHGRWFTDYTEAQMTALLARHPVVQIAEIWTSMDVRPGRDGERWLDVIARKAA